jgi:ATP-dependent Clp protease ATP-binding subunit ClpA
MSVSGQLICRLAEEAADAGTPEVALQRLTELRSELDEFERQQVARALTAGRTFGAVARAMGITRQAVHRRFRDLAPRRARGGSRLPPTAEVRLVVEYAVAEAARFGATRLSPEHVILGILRGGDRRAASALTTAGVTLDEARGAVRLAPGAPPAPRPGRGLDIRTVLAEAVRCACQRGDSRIEVEHLLRAALAADDGAAPRLLGSLGVKPPDVLAGLDEAPAGDTGCL